MRLASRALLRDALALVAVTVVSLVIMGILCQARFHETRHVYVVVDEGLPFAEIAGRFKSSGLITDEFVFLVLGRALGIERKAKAGRYRFRSTSDMIEILTSLYRGATYREKVRILAGRTVEGIAHVLAERAAIDSVLFVSLCSDSAVVGRLGIPSVSAEGYLFPDTYDIEWREDAEKVMKTMVARFFRAFDESLATRSERIGMTVNEAVTLASIIEKEAMLDKERPRISAVFHNRLTQGMKLQADPTVRYALRKWTGRMVYKDLKVDSPFNTYLVRGLPPSPICNPGLPSLIAAVNPLPGSQELYFVAQGDGSHYFSKSAKEHQRAKARYKTYLKSLQMGRPSGREEDT